jgi:hypothetical protein
MGGRGACGAFPPKALPVAAHPNPRAGCARIEMAPRGSAGQERGKGEGRFSSSPSAIGLVLVLVLVLAVYNL